MPANQEILAEIKKLVYITIIHQYSKYEDLVLESASDTVFIYNIPFKLEFIYEESLNRYNVDLDFADERAFNKLKKHNYPLSDKVLECLYNLRTRICYGLDNFYKENN